MSFSGLSLKSVMAEVTADAGKYAEVVKIWFDKVENSIQTTASAAKVEAIYTACVAEIESAAERVEHLKLWAAIEAELGLRATTPAEPVGN